MKIIDQVEDDRLTILGVSAKSRQRRFLVSTKLLNLIRKCLYIMDDDDLQRYLYVITMKLGECDYLWKMYSKYIRTLSASHRNFHFENSSIFLHSKFFILFTIARILALDLYSVRNRLVFPRRKLLGFCEIWKVFESKLNLKKNAEEQYL